MAPIILDTTPDLDLDGPATMARNNTPPFTTNAPTTDTGSTITTTTQQQQLQQQHKRTLLLAPPALASREDRLSALFATAYPRATTDLHMLDRLAAGLVALPAATYDLVLVLTDPDPVPSPNGGNNNNSNNSSSSSLLGGSSRAAWARLAGALRPGGRLEFESAEEGRDATVAREAVLAGLVPASEREEGGAAAFVKPEYAEEEVVPLRLLGGKGRKKEEEQNGAVQPPPAAAPAAVAGVGFVDFSDDLDLDAEDDDDVIDEDTLLTEEDLRRPIQQPPECQPQPGKKRRACKDWYVYPPSLPDGFSPAHANAGKNKHVRPGGEARGRGPGAAREGRQGPGLAEAQVGGPERARLHRPGQDGLVRQLLPRRRLPLLRLPLHRAARIRTCPLHPFPLFTLFPARVTFRLVLDGQDEKN